MDYHALKVELALPAYAGATDTEAAALLMAVNQEVARTSISAVELWERTTLAEYAALTQAQRDAYGVLIAMGTIDVSAGTNSRASLSAMFGAGTATRAALVALLALPILKSRADVLGLGEVTAGDVQRARAGAY